MKLVVQNPQLTSDTWTSGINDYVVELLRVFRPAIRIHPPRRWVRWMKFLLAKRLPLTGWEYVTSDSGLRRIDVWLSFSGSGAIHHDPIAPAFTGLKLYHVMDFTFHTGAVRRQLLERKVDFLMGYARHDRWCAFFRSQFPEFVGRVIPVPFGFSRRFVCRTPFQQRLAMCAAMGAVNPVRDPVSDPAAISEYAEFFREVEWAHPLRAAVRERLAQLEDVVVNYLPVPPASKSARYDSVEALNKCQMFVNDDSIMHYPPARTFEGTACGTVMVCSDHPCYDDYGWVHGRNCLRHRFGDVDDFARVVRRARADQDQLRLLHEETLRTASGFSHMEVAKGIVHMVDRIWAAGRVDPDEFWRGSVPAAQTARRAASQ